MDCSKFKSDIFAFREGALSEESTHSAKLHLASCRACNWLLSEFNALDAIIEQEKLAEPNPFAATRILQRLENEVEQQKNYHFPRWIRILQPATISLALLCGIFIGSFTAKKDSTQVSRLVNTSENIEFLRSNLFISEFADEDKILVLNK